MVIFDASFLILAFDKEAASKQGTPRLSERIGVLLEDLQKARTRVLIPTPALSEFLVKADVRLLEEIRLTTGFKIVPFDERAAIEAAELTKRAVKESDKNDPVVAATWSKIKFDRQIVAIAKVEGADTIYSTDQHIAKQAQQAGIICRGIVDLPPAPVIQEKFKYEGKDEGESKTVSPSPEVRSGDRGRASDETRTQENEATGEQTPPTSEGDEG